MSGRNGSAETQMREQTRAECKCGSNPSLCIHLRVKQQGQGSVQPTCMQDLRTLAEQRVCLLYKTTFLLTCSIASVSLLNNEHRYVSSLHQPMRVQLAYNYPEAMVAIIRQVAEVRPIEQEVSAQHMGVGHPTIIFSTSQRVAWESTIRPFPFLFFQASRSYRYVNIEYGSLSSLSMRFMTVGRSEISSLYCEESAL